MVRRGDLTSPRTAGRDGRGHSVTPGTVPQGTTVESHGGTPISGMGGDLKMERRMSPRFLLLTLSAAFGIAVLFATLTTVRQLHIQTSAISQPLHRS